MAPKTKSLGEMIHQYQTLVDSPVNDGSAEEAIFQAESSIRMLLRESIPAGMQPDEDCTYVDTRCSWAACIRKLPSEQSIISAAEMKKLAEISERRIHEGEVREPGSFEAGLLYHILGQRESMLRCLQDASIPLGSDALKAFRKADPSLIDFRAAMLAIGYDFEDGVNSGQPEIFYRNFFYAMDVAGITEFSAQHIQHLLKTIESASREKHKHAWYSEMSAQYEERDENAAFLHEEFAGIPKGKPLHPQQIFTIFDHYFDKRYTGQQTPEFGPHTMRLLESLLMARETEQGSKHQNFLVRKFINVIAE